MTAKTQKAASARAGRDAYDDFLDHEWSTQREFDVAGAPWQFSYLHTHMIPAMLKAGISAEAISQMTVENPRRLLESVPAY